MNKVIACVLLGVATLAAGTARAGGVSWSIDINTPVIGTVISNAPAYWGPVYGVPVYAQAPVYVQAPVPVYEAPYRAIYPAEYATEYRPAYRQVFRDGRDGYRPGYRPAPVVYVRDGGRRWDHYDHHHDRREGHWREHDERHEGWRR